MLTSTQKKVLIFLVCVVLFGVVFVMLLQRYGSLLRGQAFNATPTTVNGQLRTESLPAGQYTLRFNGKTQSKDLSTSTTFQIGSGSVTPYP